MGAGQHGCNVTLTLFGAAQLPTASSGEFQFCHQLFDVKTKIPGILLTATEEVSHFLKNVF